MAMALLFTLLSLFNNVGYHINSMEELSHNPRNGYVDVDFSFDATYSPLLRPLNWIMGKGHIHGNFSITYYTKVWQEIFIVRSLSAEERSEGFMLSMTAWGIIPNLIVLLFLTIIIETIRQRQLYVALFSGVIGFVAAGIPGTIAGFAVGMVFNLIYKHKLPKNNILARYWNYLSK